MPSSAVQKLRRLAALLGSSGVLLLGPGCSPADEPAQPQAPDEATGLTSTAAQALKSDNGLSLNGLSLNGLSLNGLSLNGLSLNGLSSSDFTAWFQQDAARADTVMRYLVHCAAPSGEVRVYEDVAAGRTYVWQGGLGLAPDWAGGRPATLVEQQVVSACLAAHANKYGVQVPISLWGRGAHGAVIPVTEAEQKQYRWRESCFFGNLFSGERLFVGRDKGRLKPRESTSRACAVTSNRDDKLDTELMAVATAGGGAEAAEADEADLEDTPEEAALARYHCAPFTYIGRCARYCVLDVSKAFYTSCTWNGVIYPALSTRLDKKSISRCGDGICQPSEACGERNDMRSCRDDCGTCG